MRIAQIAPLAEPVPPKLYGGTERVIATLTEDLVGRGHDVTLFASGDSQTSARLVPCAPSALRLNPASVDPISALFAALARVGELEQEFDVIHCHVDYPAYPFERQWTTPTVNTLHGRLDIAGLDALYRSFRDMRLISISDNQREPLAEVHPDWVATVYNGVAPEHFPFGDRPDNYLLFVGRLSVEKRPDVAIEVARRAGMPLKMAGKVDEVDRAWFEEHVAPLLDDPLVDFVGETDEATKLALLRGAAGLLFPIMWPEPFGMVMVEAMACGTPVIALRNGAAPEVVADGRTGVICDSVDDMVASVARLGEIDRATCRRHVEEHFSDRVMADGYLAAYERVLSPVGARR